MDALFAFGFGFFSGAALLLFLANVYVLWREGVELRRALRGMGRSPMQAKRSESQSCSARSARDSRRRPFEQQTREG